MDQTTGNRPEHLLSVDDKKLLPEIHSADAQKELYSFQHRVAEANEAIVPEPSYNTFTPKGKQATLSWR